MRILFTGASSFTGFWFARALAQAGHAVTAIFTKGSPEDYAGLRRQRVEMLLPLVSPKFGTNFGDTEFLNLISQGEPWDLFCHHAAEVADFKSPSFNVGAALANNTNNLRAVLDGLRHGERPAVILTGSYFEPDEGEGAQPREAFSPYGLSKGLTWQVFRFWCHAKGVRLAKFVMPNPFGPYEDKGFTSYLAKTWLAGEAAVVRTPDYIRDNIHVSLLAKAYLSFVTQFAANNEPMMRLNPSGYVSSQGDFADRFAQEMRIRLGVPCQVSRQVQIDFTEPVARFNTDSAAKLHPDWSERNAWEEAAAAYRELSP